MRGEFWVEILFVGLLVSACESGNGAADGGAGVSGMAGTRGAGGEDVGAGGNNAGKDGSGDADVHDGATGGTCAIVSRPLNSLPPDIIVLQDRSGSMTRTAQGTPGNPTKWVTLTNALGQVLAQTESTVRWGMQMFPNCKPTGVNLGCAPTPCTISGLYQAPDLNQAQVLESLLTSNAPPIDTGATPTTAAIRTGIAALKALDTPNKKFLVLVTDGEPNCRNASGSSTGSGEPDSVAAIQAVKDAAADGIPVFVIGIATLNSSANTTLNEMALAGGRALNGATKYYSADDLPQLVSALNAVSGLVRICEYALNVQSTSGESFRVILDGTALQEGTEWRFGADKKSVVILGNRCTELNNGTAKQVSVETKVCVGEASGGGGASAGGAGGGMCAPSTTHVPISGPTLLTVMDRSGSMVYNINGCIVGSSGCPGMVGLAPGPQRWAIVRGALERAMEATSQSIDWGMKMYPTCRNQVNNPNIYNCEYPVGTNDACAIEGMAYTPGFDQFATLKVALAQNAPGPNIAGATPTRLAVNAAVEMLKAQPPTAAKRHLLLITDGEPNCGTYAGVPVDASHCIVGKPCDAVPDVEGAVAAIAAAKSAGVPVFVVGVTMPDTRLAVHAALNAAADAGGKPRTDNQAFRYYVAAEGISIQNALDSVISEVMDCQFDFAIPSGTNVSLRVNLGNTVVPLDAVNGFSFLPGRTGVQFNGTACVEIRKGKLPRVDITVACPN